MTNTINDDEEGEVNSPMEEEGHANVPAAHSNGIQSNIKYRLKLHNKLRVKFAENLNQIHYVYRPEHQYKAAAKQSDGGDLCIIF